MATSVSTDLRSIVAHPLLTCRSAIHAAPNLEDHEPHDPHRSGAVRRPAERAGRAQAAPRGRLAGVAARRARLRQDPAGQRARARRSARRARSSSATRATARPRCARAPSARCAACPGTLAQTLAQQARVLVIDDIQHLRIDEATSLLAPLLLGPTALGRVVVVGRDPLAAAVGASIAELELHGLDVDAASALWTQPRGDVRRGRGLRRRVRAHARRAARAAPRVRARAVRRAARGTSPRSSRRRAPRSRRSRSCASRSRPPRSPRSRPASISRPR